MAIAVGRDAIPPNPFIVAYFQALSKGRQGAVIRQGFASWTVLPYNGRDFHEEADHESHRSAV
jgi:hypothetical protein